MTVQDAAEAVAVLEAVRERKRLLEELRRGADAAAEAGRASRHSMATLYLSPIERLRVLSSLAGLGAAAAAAAAGAPLALMLPRLAGNLWNLSRAGRRVEAGLLPLYLEELFAAMDA